MVRWRTYANAAVLTEIARLRLDVHALQSSSTPQVEMVVERPARVALMRERPDRAPRLDWSLDDEPMPHLEAAIETADRRSGGRLSVSGSLTDLAQASRELSAWLERTTIPDDFGPLTIVLSVARKGDDV